MAQRLPPSSRLRQAFTRRAVEIAFDAANRGDYEAAFMLYHPDIELIAPQQIVALGLNPTYSGKEARVQFQRDWSAEWGAFKFEPSELTYLGDRLLVTGRITGAGRSSGAAFDSEWGVLVRLDSGQVTEERFFFDLSQALEAAGLGPESRSVAA